MTGSIATKMTIKATALDTAVGTAVAIAVAVAELCMTIVCFIFMFDARSAVGSDGTSSV